jgi:hypothetical protein
MQTIRRLAIASLWVFTLYFGSESIGGLKTGISGYCSGAGCGSDAEKTFLWVAMGTLLLIAILAHFLILWIFADKKR